MIYLVKYQKKNYQKIINYYQRKFHNYNSQSLNKICAHLSDNVNLIDEYNNYGLNSNIIKPKFLIDKTVVIFKIRFKIF